MGYASFEKTRESSCGLPFSQKALELLIVIQDWFVHLVTVSEGLCDHFKLLAMETFKTNPRNLERQFVKIDEDFFISDVTGRNGTG